MSVTLIPAAVDTAGLEQQIADAHSVAAAAEAKAANARQMVLNRDPVLTSLQDVASKFAVEIARTDKIHADLQTGVDQANARAMTPGPAGKAGTNGTNGADGQPGTKGDKGNTGDAGTANLALGAAPVPLIALNGNTTITVPLSRTMPNNTYTVQAAHSAVVNLATMTIAVTAKTTTTVTVKVTSVGVATAAGTLVVVAY